MGINKVNYGETTLIDISNDTVTAGSMLSGTTAHDNTGAAITGTIASKSSSDLTASGATVTVPAGYYASQASKAVATGTAGTPTATKGTVSSHSISVTPSVTNTAGYISGGTKTGTAVTVSASELVSGNKSITSNGTGIDVANYSTCSVNVAASLNKETLTKKLSKKASSISFTLKGAPKYFTLAYGGQLGDMASTVVCVIYNGTATTGIFNSANYPCYYSTSLFSFSYSGTTLTITSGSYAGSSIKFFGASYSDNYILNYIY